MRILLLEPDEYYHHRFRELFDDIGEVKVSKTGEDILEIMAEAPVDMIITELVLLKLSAFEIIDKVRKLEKGVRTPVVIHASSAHLEDIENALRLGAMGYFLKGENSIPEIKRLVLNYN